MKLFHCDNCGMMVFFENYTCGRCGEQLGFLPEQLEMSSESNWGGYRSCGNRQQHHVCNWLIPAEDPNAFCLSCRLNQVIPDLSMPGNLGRWAKIESAKRRCLETLLRLGLTVVGSGGNQSDLSFRFLADGPNLPPVLTGHEDGVVTLNIAEADEDERERRRVAMHEPYRTLVGHFRHELGHYYWDHLIANSTNLPRFRELFGDETRDYDAAVAHYYQNGPAPDWSASMVTEYASMHPWEDWAESWAHYLHMVDTLETVTNFGLAMGGTNFQDGEASDSASNAPSQTTEFDKMISGWFPLTCALNAVTRGMGLLDLYPFVIPERAVEKLRFIHDVIQSSAAGVGATTSTTGAKPAELQPLTR